MIVYQCIYIQIYTIKGGEKTLKKKTNKIQYNFRIDIENLEKLQNIAENQERTTSNLINLILKKYLELHN